jgi:hypothetical protein
MKVRMYPLIERLVEEGIESGWQHAHKHTDSPIEETIKHCIQQYMMLGFDEVFQFDQED